MVLKKQKVASYQYLRAIDHVLTLAGAPLNSFRPLKAQSRLTRAGEVRYLVATSPWGSYAAAVGTPWLRSCITNVATGERRFEVSCSLEASQCPVLTVTSDEDGKCMAPLQFLANGLGFRVVMLRDQAHRHWRDLRLSLEEV